MTFSKLFLLFAGFLFAGLLLYLVASNKLSSAITRRKERMLKRKIEKEGHSMYPLW